MSWLELIKTVIEFALQLWKSQQKTSEQQKLEAITAIVKKTDVELATFHEALATGNTVQLSLSFEQLRERVLRATGGVI